jgi:hypothetical protein
LTMGSCAYECVDDGLMCIYVHALTLPLPVSRLRYAWPGVCRFGLIGSSLVRPKQSAVRLLELRAGPSPSPAGVFASLVSHSRTRSSAAALHRPVLGSLEGEGRPESASEGLRTTSSPGSCPLSVLARRGIPDFKVSKFPTRICGQTGIPSPFPAKSGIGDFRVDLTSSGALGPATQLVTWRT